MSNTLITADNHWGHRNILYHANRIPWLSPNPSYDFNKKNNLKYNNPLVGNIEKHDSDLIEHWNDIVGKNDTVYIIGDYAFKNHNYYLNALNGKKIIILGSHDKMSQMSRQNFTEVHDFGCVRKIKDLKITMCHYALKSWAGSFHGWPFINLYGHSHGRMPEFDNMLSFDVGVDIWDYRPIPIEVVIKKVDLIRENVEKLVDGETKAIGTYNKDYEQRMVDLRIKNFEILRSVGVDVKYPFFETKQETIDKALESLNEK